MKNAFYLLFFLLIEKQALSQFIGDNEIKASQLTSWKASQKNDYVGYYKFGFSESESFLLITYNNKWEAKLLTTEYNDKTDNWDDVVKKLTNVNVINGNIYSKEFSGRFVYYNEKGKKYKALQVLKNWYTLGESEVGLLKQEY